MRVSTNFYVLAIAATVFAPVCRAKTKQPVFVDPGFRFEDVDSVYILPTVDLRAKKDENAEEGLLSVDWYVRYYLKQRGYRTVPQGCCSKTNPEADREYRFFMKQHEDEAKGRQPAHPARMDVDEDELKEPQESWIRKLGPDDAHWVLILALEDSESHMTFGSSGRAIVMGTLFDRQNGKLVWRAIGAGHVGQGGLLGMALRPAMAVMAIRDAVVELCSMVGKKKKQ